MNRTNEARGPIVPHTTRRETTSARWSSAKQFHLSRQQKNKVHPKQSLPCLCHAYVMPISLPMPCQCHAYALPMPCLCLAYAMPMPMPCLHVRRAHDITNSALGTRIGSTGVVSSRPSTTVPQHAEPSHHQVKPRARVAKRLKAGHAVCTVQSPVDKSSSCQQV